MHSRILFRTQKIQTGRVSLRRQRPRAHRRCPEYRLRRRAQQQTYQSLNPAGLYKASWIMVGDQNRVVRGRKRRKLRCTKASRWQITVKNWWDKAAATVACSSSLSTRQVTRSRDPSVLRAPQWHAHRSQSWSLIPQSILYGTTLSRRVVGRLFSRAHWLRSSKKSKASDPGNVENTYHLKSQ